MYIGYYKKKIIKNKEKEYKTKLFENLVNNLLGTSIIYDCRLILHNICFKYLMNPI